MKSLQIAVMALICAGNLLHAQDTPDASDAKALQVKLKEAATTNQPLAIHPLVGVGEIRFGMTTAELEKHLGKPYRSSKGVHEYQLLGMAFGIDANGSINAIMAGGWCDPSDVLCDVFKGKTDKGIRMRSTREDVQAAYGEPTKQRQIAEGDKDFVLWSYDELRMRLAFRNNKLVHITLLPKPKK